uniref:F-box protein At2g26160-like n=2 Tax=Nicotiana tabacum TaxID=4097 RepID=A0A1S3XPC0_TOBAC|nr:PREDICTED: F-box protein At2g26160-like [Nicotiana tabacum]
MGQRRRRKRKTRKKRTLGSSTSLIPNWSELQYDVLVHVARRLNLIEDYLNFAAVCKPWRLAATKENFNSDLPRVPWLMLAEEEGSDVSSCRKFFNLCNDLIFKTTIPQASGKRCLESMGWLITVGIDGEISLLHPFSGVQIELPHQNTTEDYTRNKTQYIWNFIHKAVLSTSPSKTSDYLLMVIEGENKYLSFWRPGDLKWTRIRRENYEPHSRDQHCDVVYFDGKFYAVDMQGNVLLRNVTDQLRLKEFPFTPVYEDEVYDEEEVPEFDGQLIFHTIFFRVYEVDLAAGKLTETKQIGDMALFLGANASLSVQASQFPGVKPNSLACKLDIGPCYYDHLVIAFSARIEAALLGVKMGLVYLSWKDSGSSATFVELKILLAILSIIQDTVTN